MCTTCPLPGSWKPILKFRSRSNGPITTLHFKSISVCENHQKTSALHSFLSDEGFDKLVHHLRDAGKEIPIRKLTTLDWEPNEETAFPSEPSIMASGESLPT